MLNNFLLLLAAAPGILLGLLLLNPDVASVLKTQTNLPLASWWLRCAESPLLAVNVLFFVGVDVWFWFLSLLQGSTWLIDPYWTLIPVMIAAYYLAHPGAIVVLQSPRCAVACTLLLVWSVRLTHSYFRREEWNIGHREDWRFDRLRNRCGFNWWWISFFAVYVSQHFMLVGITMPLLPITVSADPWHPIWDTLIAATCAAGILIAWVSDNQLRAFMVDNEKRAASGKPKVLVLDTGIWYYSRHPNYFGEQLWWWGMALWAIYLGSGWMVVGTAFNSLCLMEVTRMVETRILEKAERVESYRAYQQATSVWIPWFKRKVKAA